MADELVDVAVEEKEIDEKGNPYAHDAHYDAVMTGATSYEQMMVAAQRTEAVADVSFCAQMFPAIVGNILRSPDVEDKEAAIANLAEEFVGMVQEKMSEASKEKAVKAVWNTKYINDLPDANFLYVEAGGKEDGEGKTVPRGKRHFPYKDAGGKVDLPHLRNAIARIPQSNAPGLTPEKKRSLQNRARKMLEEAQKDLSLLDRLRLKLGSEQIEDVEESKSGSFMVWKDDGGQYRWLAVYSNNYRDMDNPPEILSAEAHKGFVKAVDGGEWPYPELRMWHVEGSRIGKANFVAYDEDTGFALAGGLIDVGREAIAKNLSQEEDLAVSHGMPTETIRRDPDDPTVIVEYRTSEISPLPYDAAANKLTAYVNAKEGIIMIPDGKRKFLEDMGFDVDELDKRLQAAKTVAEIAGLDSKESPTEQVPVEVAEGTIEEEDELSEVLEQVTLLRTDTEAALNELRGQFEALGKELLPFLQAQEAEIERLKATPAASSPFFSRAIGARATLVSEKSKLAKDGPKETPDDAPRPGASPFAVVEALKHGGDWRKVFNLGQEQEGEG